MNNNNTKILEALEKKPVRTSGFSSENLTVVAGTNQYLPIIDVSEYKKISVTGWGAYGNSEGNVKVRLYFDDVEVGFDGGVVAVGTYDNGTLYFGNVDLTSKYVRCRIYNDSSSDEDITIKYFLTT